MDAFAPCMFIDANAVSRPVDGFGGGGGTGGLLPNPDVELVFGIASLRSVSACDANASRSTLRSEIREDAWRLSTVVSSVNSA